MKCEINRMGTLILIAENNTEEYALRKWREENFINCEDVIRNQRGHWIGSSLITSEDGE